MPEMTPVADQIQPPSATAGMDAYSRLLGIQQQRLALQTGQAGLVQAQAQASLEARVARERQALSGVNWSQFQQPDGSFDEDAVTKTALAVAPTTGEQFAQQFNAMNEGSAQTKKAWLGLNTDLQDRVRSTFGAWAADPNSTSTELAAQLENLEDNAPPGMRGQVSQIADHATRAMGMVPGPAQKQMAMALARAGLGQSELTGPGGLGTPNTGMVNVGPAVVPTSQSRVTGAVTPQPGGLATGLPPGVQVLTDAYGRQYRYNTQTGQMEGQVGAPPQGGTTGAGGFTQPVADQGQIVQDVHNVRHADADYGLNHYINNQILRLSQNTATGPGSQEWHYVLGAITGGPGPGNSVSDYQTISAYLDRQGAMAQKQMGLPETNAGLETAKSLTATTGYSPEALRTKVRLTDALVEGAHQYREGLDRVVGVGPNMDLSKYQAYRSAWAQNFDPNVFLAEDAFRSGDKEELGRLRQELGPDGLKQLAAKRRTLMQLSQGMLNGG